MSKVRVHTVDQKDSDTTTFVLSCDRLDILDVTLQSFWQTRDYDTKMVIVDDSGNPEVFDKLVEKYGAFSDVICFPKNRTQWWAMDFMVSWCDTEYIFYLEDDWKLLRKGYLNKSKEILQKYREVGVVDISWRTFEWQGIDSYDKTLVDGMFYWKKPWQITPYHLTWYGWVGSPNLRRRDDLILLGRIEKWHNEWNIDRKFRSLGFKGVFLDGEYAQHLGDYRSKMADRRPDDSKTPEDFYPKELLPDRIYPKLDWMFLDHGRLKYPNQITLVTGLVNIDREGRDFEEHYLSGLERVLNSRHPTIVFCEEKYFDRVLSMAKTNVQLIKYGKEEIENQPHFDKIKNIIESPNWYNQSDWMKDSVIRNEYYIPLTLAKSKMMVTAAQMNPFGSYHFLWIDAGIYNSYNVQEDLNAFYFCKTPTEKFFMTAFPYYSEQEMHGYNMKDMIEFAGSRPEYVCRATIFGGMAKQIYEVDRLFNEMVGMSVDAGCIGTEEAIYSILNTKYPNLMNIHKMPNGDINNFLRTIKL